MKSNALRKVTLVIAIALFVLGIADLVILLPKYHASIDSYDRLNSLSFMKNSEAISSCKEEAKLYLTLMLSGLFSCTIFGFLFLSASEILSRIDKVYKAISSK